MRGLEGPRPPGSAAPGPLATWSTRAGTRCICSRMAFSLIAGTLRRVAKRHPRAVLALRAAASRPRPPAATRGSRREKRTTGPSTRAPHPDIDGAVHVAALRDLSGATRNFFALVEDPAARASPRG